jgi:hypothetical protein
MTKNSSLRSKASYYWPWLLRKRSNIGIVPGVKDSAVESFAG